MHYFIILMRIQKVFVVFGWTVHALLCSYVLFRRLQRAMKAFTAKRKMFDFCFSILICGVHRLLKLTNWALPLWMWNRFNHKHKQLFTRISYRRNECFVRCCCCWYEYEVSIIIYNVHATWLICQLFRSWLTSLRVQQNFLRWKKTK